MRADGLDRPSSGYGCITRDLEMNSRMLGGPGVRARSATSAEELATSWAGERAATSCGGQARSASAEELAMSCERRGACDEK